MHKRINFISKTYIDEFYRIFLIALYVFRDSVAHVPDADLNFDKILGIMGNVSGLVLDTFPKVKVYPSLGNHDWWPAHQYPNGASPYYDKILTISNWQRMLDKEAAETFKKGRDDSGMHVYLKY